MIQDADGVAVQDKVPTPPLPIRTSWGDVTAAAAALKWSADASRLIQSAGPKLAVRLMAEVTLAIVRGLLDPETLPVQPAKAKDTFGRALTVSAAAVGKL